MPAKRERVKGRKDSGQFFAFPGHILNSEEFIRLSVHTKVLLMDLCAQYRGKNNGDLCCAWKLMEKRGWRSRDTLFKAQTELEEKGFIQRTRQGGRNMANLFALTWLAIDDCKGKLDVNPTRVASNLWKNSITRIAC